MTDASLGTWSDVVVASFQNTWAIFMSFIPNLIGALAVLIVGLIVAAGIGTLVEKIFEAARLDPFLEKLGLKPHFERAGLRLRGAYFLGRLTYWFIIIAFLIAVADILRLETFSVFLNRVLEFIPNIAVAVLILLAAVVIANLLKRTVVASVTGAKLHAARFLGSLAWWAVVVFGILTALTQLGIGEDIIKIVVTGFIAMLAIGGGLALGLGGKDYANHLINRLRENLESR